MKKQLLSLALAFSGFAALAQDETSSPTEQGGFKKENIFVGGGIGLGSSSIFGGGFGGNSFFWSISPQFGYSLTKWLDLGMDIGYSSNAGSNGNISFSLKSFTVGPFARIFPIPQLYLIAQPEFVSITASQSGLQDFTGRANCFLIGAGYTSSLGSDGNYFFTSILFDVANDVNSPYRLPDGAGGQGIKVPVIRSGIVIHLNP
jgi:hypothetical protein